jgi:hypothetical protein
LLAISASTNGQFQQIDNTTSFRWDETIVRSKSDLIGSRRRFLLLFRR